MIISDMFGMQIQVAIAAIALVFNEVVGLINFSNVVVIRSDAAEQSVGPDLLRCLGR